MNQFQALVIDDEPQVREFVSTILTNDGWQVAQSESAEEAFNMLNDEAWSVVFCDVMLGGADGYSVLRRFKEELPETKVVLMTGHGTAVGALDATAFGAYDYLLKPFGPEEVGSLATALREQLSEKTRVLSPKHHAGYRTDIELVGRSHAFIEVMKQVGRVAPTNLPVLLTGESGTGKELVASTIHQRSGRGDRTFVAVNCGAIPAELIEAELFGHVKGSFTGADRDRTGKLSDVGRGTLLLDDIDALPLVVQAKLLRAIEERVFEPVGSNQTHKVEARLVAASNRPLLKEVPIDRSQVQLRLTLNVSALDDPGNRKPIVISQEPFSKERSG